MGKRQKAFTIAIPSTVAIAVGLTSGLVFRPKTAYVINMFIQTEQTPNPETLKFLPGRDVTGGAIAEYKSAEEAAAGSPLAQRLFTIETVQSVFLGKDFVSVTKTPDEEWYFLKSKILAEMMEFFMTGQPVLLDDGQKPVAVGEDDDEISRQIRELLETRVQPAVAADGGHIEFVRFEDGIAYLRMQGACAGCPSSAITLKSGIENMLKHYVPEVVAVEAIPEM